MQQTRRDRTLGPIDRSPRTSFPLIHSKGDGKTPLFNVTRRANGLDDNQTSELFCPNGQHGDRLWVRENFSGGYSLLLKNIPPKNWPEDTRIWYWADGECGLSETTRIYSSIHMPRKFSRITLEITGVKVERLQDISEGDARAEGAQKHTYSWPDGTSADNARDTGGSYRNGFRNIWESINGKTPGKTWDDNPWVWAVSFQREA